MDGPAPRISFFDILLGLFAPSGDEEPPAVLYPLPPQPEERRQTLGRHLPPTPWREGQIFVDEDTDLFYMCTEFGWMLLHPPHS